MKFDLVPPPEPEPGADESVDAFTRRRAAVRPSIPKLPHVGDVRGELGRRRLNRAIAQVRTVVEDLRARAAAEAMEQAPAAPETEPGTAEVFRPARFRHRTDGDR
ncbi:hypothetical protein [Nocardiopsis sp. LOL_012]|uniref:hypothetical protein n=1 Tax=Nocardiopsis sp. LOL_012 TaxID=3345409 RepID=UPI003A86B59B